MNGKLGQLLLPPQWPVLSGTFNPLSKPMKDTSFQKFVFDYIIHLIFTI